MLNPCFIKDPTYLTSYKNLLPRTSTNVIQSYVKQVKAATKHIAKPFLLHSYLRHTVSFCPVGAQLAHSAYIIKMHDAVFSKQKPVRYINTSIIKLVVILELCAVYLFAVCHFF